MDVDIVNEKVMELLNCAGSKEKVKIMEALGEISAYVQHAEGILYTMGFHGRLQDLPKKSLDKLRQLGNLGKNYT